MNNRKLTRKDIDKYLKTREKHKDFLTDIIRDLEARTENITIFIFGIGIGIISNIFVDSAGLTKENHVVAIISGLVLLSLVIFIYGGLRQKDEEIKVLSWAKERISLEQEALGDTGNYRNASIEALSRIEKLKK